MKAKLTGLLLGILFLAACTTETVEVTREVETEVEVTRMVEVEVTRQVEQEVEVTRVVEVTREVEVEVTREVEATRIVEVEVTAVPTETPTPLPTNTPLPPSSDQEEAPPPTEEANTEDALLTTMLQVRTDMQNFGGMIDAALRSGVINCQDVVDTYDRIVTASTFDVSGASPAAQSAYGAYRAALDVFNEGAWDMAENCRNALAEGSGTSIGFQQWGAARQEVNRAIDVIHPAIQSLGGE